MLATFKNSALNAVFPIYVSQIFNRLSKCKNRKMKFKSDTTQTMKFSIKDFFCNMTKFTGNCGVGHIY